MSMNPEDLRIGNLVRQKGIEGDLGMIEVESIHEDGINVRAETHYNGYEGYGVLEVGYEWKEIEGIPLTEEWLEKFGFVFDGIMWWDKDGFGYSFIDQRCSHEHKENVFNELPFYQYIHQLQNLYHSLTGEDLPTLKDKTMIQDNTDDLERGTEHNVAIVSKFMEHCEMNGHIVPEDLFITFFNG